MANTVFIAVQCCQCSTMQVKQQKKSSSKWTCVVCNQKQSVLKVFARGFMAKDVRKFVQSFNMSRKFADEQGDRFTPEIGQEEEVEEMTNKNKRRVDWSEYMDGDGDGDDLRGGVEGVGGEMEPEIVTEWPDEVFKKPKVNVKSYYGFSHGQCEASYKPIFSKWTNDCNRQGKEMRSQPRNYKERLTGEGSIQEICGQFGNPKQSQNVQQPTKSIPAAKFGASKWDQYITENDGNQFSREKNCDSTAADDLGFRYEYDQEVEEDVHPDFL